VLAIKVKRHCSSPHHSVENLPFKAFDISNGLVLCVFKQVPLKKNVARFIA